MAVTPSTMVELGSTMPEFELLNPHTQTHVSSQSVLGERGVLVAFICNHCPFVVHLRGHFEELHQWCIDCGIGFVAINANDARAYPEDGPDAMAELTESLGWTFPYLFDDSQETARAFSAACTPDFFLYDSEGLLYYRGQFDSSRPNNGIAVTGADVRNALRRLSEGKAPPAEQHPSMGCNIKWKA